MSKTNLVERVLVRLLEASEMPSDEVLDGLASSDQVEELDEDEFKRGEWQPGVGESIRVRSTPGAEIDIDERELPEGATGKIVNHLVAYKVEFNDDEIGARWVTKAMIEPK